VLLVSLISQFVVLLVWWNVETSETKRNHVVSAECFLSDDLLETGAPIYFPISSAFWLAVLTALMTAARKP
jgi:hypothetical protein